MSTQSNNTNQNRSNFKVEGRIIRRRKCVRYRIEIEIPITFASELESLEKWCGFPSEFEGYLEQIRARAHTTEARVQTFCGRRGFKTAANTSDTKGQRSHNE